jgi:hypothetical protein
VPRYRSISLIAALLVGLVPARAGAQSVTLPLRGEGELDLPSGIQPVGRGSVTLRAADSGVRLVFVDAGTPRAVLAGRWRMADHRSAALEVDSLIESEIASGAGAIQFHPDGSVDELDISGTADGEPFSIRFDNSTSIGLARPDTGAVETGALTPRSRAGDWPWATRWSVLDATHRGAGVLKHADGREVRFARARLTLGANEEFMLVLDGNRRAEFIGVWRRDLGSGTVRLQLREALGRPVGGVGRAWLDERELQHDPSFARVELDGWDDEAGDAFTLYFDTNPR